MVLALLYMAFKQRTSSDGVVWPSVATFYKAFHGSPSVICEVLFAVIQRYVLEVGAFQGVAV
jgi:hypothetical protein